MKKVANLRKNPYDLKSIRKLAPGQGAIRKTALKLYQWLGIRIRQDRCDRELVGHALAPFVHGIGVPR